MPSKRKSQKTTEPQPIAAVLEEMPIAEVLPTERDIVHRPTGPSGKWADGLKPMEFYEASL